MASTYEWLDGSSNISDGTNWRKTSDGSTGTVPALTDNMHILWGSRNLTTGQDQSAVNQNNLIIGEDFTGTIGTAAAPLKLGTMTGKIEVRASRAGAIHLHPVSVGAMYIHDCGSGSHACHLVDGTVTALYPCAGHGIRIGAAATVTNLYGMQLTGLPGYPRVIVESGATVTNAELSGGEVHSSAAIATSLILRGGRWYQEGDTTYDIPALTMHGGFFFMNSTRGTITTTVVKGGTWNGTQTSKAYTLTNASVWGGGTMLCNDQTIHTNNVGIYGGRYVGPGGITVYIPSTPK